MDRSFLLAVALVGLACRRESREVVPPYEPRRVSPAVAAPVMEQIRQSPEIADEIEPAPEPAPTRFSTRREPPAVNRSPTFRVVQVSRDDVLNLRAGPGVDGEVIAAIPPEAAGVVALGPAERRGRSLWREVEYEGVRGWANARFLEPEAPISAPSRSSSPSPLAAALTCSGTEPFWTIHVEADRAVSCLQTCPPGLRAAAPSLTGENAWSLGVERRDGERFLTMLLRRTHRCSDDMSDQLHEYSVTVDFADGESSTGCCRH